MTALDSLTPEVLVREMVEYDGQDRAVIGGQVVASLGFTQAAVGTLSPREWLDLADYLSGAISRAPIATSPLYAGHRIVLGMLATELRGYAAAAGEMSATPAESLAYSEHVDDVIADHRSRQELAAPTTEPDDAFALL